VTSPAVRAAVYTVFAARRIARWMIGAALVLAGLCVLYVVGLWLYYTEPWYDHDVIRQRASAPRTAPWADLSDQAAAILPDGTTYRAAVALLRANSSTCNEAAVDAQQITLKLRARAACAFMRG
jgi:hypothetical protein